MHPDYLVLRLVRRFTPQPLFRALLRRSLIVRPGIETRAPELALDEYRSLLVQSGLSLDAKRVLLLGYGGNFTLGCMLLNQGASHVTLLDPFAPPNDRANAALLDVPEFAPFLVEEGAAVRPRPQFMSLLQADICDLAPGTLVEPFDLALSRSVFEHLKDVEGVTRALAALTKPSGMNLHLIDLSDHYFKYPFEMLSYSEKVWRNWLNPPSNLNRWRYQDYRRVFEENYTAVTITVQLSDQAAFLRARSRIRPEFLSADPRDSGTEAATFIAVLAAGPKKPQTKASID